MSNSADETNSRAGRRGQKEQSAGQGQGNKSSKQHGGHIRSRMQIMHVMKTSWSLSSLPTIHLHIRCLHCRFSGLVFAH